MAVQSALTGWQGCRLAWAGRWSWRWSSPWGWRFAERWRWRFAERWGWRGGSLERRTSLHKHLQCEPHAVGSQEAPLVL